MPENIFIIPPISYPYRIISMLYYKREKYRHSKKISKKGKNCRLSTAVGAICQNGRIKRVVDKVASARKFRYRFSDYRQTQPYLDLPDICDFDHSFNWF